MCFSRGSHVRSRTSMSMCQIRENLEKGLIIGSPITDLNLQAIVANAIVTSYNHGRVIHEK